MPTTTGGLLVLSLSLSLTSKISQARQAQCELLYKFIILWGLVFVGLLFIETAKASQPMPSCKKTLDTKEIQNYRNLVLQDKVYQTVFKSDPSQLDVYISDCADGGIRGDIRVGGYFEDKQVDVLEKSCSVSRVSFDFTMANNKISYIYNLGNYLGVEKFHPQNWTRDFLVTTFTKVATSPLVKEIFEKSHFCQVVEGAGGLQMQLRTHKKSKSIYFYLFNTQGDLKYIRFDNVNMSSILQVFGRPFSKIRSVYLIQSVEKCPYIDQQTRNKPEKVRVQVKGSMIFDMSLGFRCLNPKNMCESTYELTGTINQDSVQDIEWKRSKVIGNTERRSFIKQWHKQPIGDEPTFFNCP